jgi:hypothetical protein
VRLNGSGADHDHADDDDPYHHYTDHHDFNERGRDPVGA